MLPSSHFLLIEDPPAGREGQLRESKPHEWSPSETQATVQRKPVVHTAQELATAFSEFIAASSRLENSHRDLQNEISDLKSELSMRLAALKRSQSENERMRLALQRILDSMPCGVLVVSAEGRITIINPEATRLLGVGELVHGGHLDNLAQLSGKCGIDLGWCAESEGSGETTREFCLRTADAVRWFEVRSQQFAGATADGKAQLMVILRDVTAHKRAEQDRDAGRTAMAREELAGILAHEIRNPLASLELFSEMIEKDESGRSQWISHLRAGLRSLSATVNNVLGFPGGTFELNQVELGSAMQSALDFVRPLIAQAGVALDAPAASDQGWILGNRPALQQLILNLASNAVRFTPPGGRIRVSIERRGLPEVRDGREIAVEFADSGCGIRVEEMDKIFEPGFSGSGETSGLGLAVCRRIMERHGGRITAENSDNGGAQFTLYFPEILPDSERA